MADWEIWMGWRLLDEYFLCSRANLSEGNCYHAVLPCLYCIGVLFFVLLEVSFLLLYHHTYHEPGVFTSFLFYSFLGFFITFLMEV